MASNFKIDLRKNCETLHIRLKGDFDGDSAARLLNTIEEFSIDTQRVYIDTGKLDRIHPFGRAVLHARLAKAIRLVDKCQIIGKHADQLII